MIALGLILAFTIILLLTKILAALSALKRLTGLEEKTFRYRPPRKPTDWFNVVDKALILGFVAVVVFNL